MASISGFALSLAISGCEAGKSSVELLYPELLDFEAAQAWTLSSPETQPIELVNYSPLLVSDIGNLLELHSHFISLTERRLRISYPPESNKEDRILTPETRVGRSLIALVPNYIPQPTGFDSLSPDQNISTTIINYNDQLTIVRPSTEINEKTKLETNGLIATALGFNLFDAHTPNNIYYQSEDTIIAWAFGFVYIAKLTSLDYQTFTERLDFENGSINSSQPEYILPKIDEEIFDKFPDKPIIKI